MRFLERLMMSVAALVLTAAGPAPVPANMDLEAGAIGSAPDGWHLADASRAAGYEAMLTTDAPQGGKASVRLTRSRSDAEAPGLGSLSQQIDATGYRGHRIRFRAAVRARPAGGWAGLWLRVDRPGGKPGFFENMQNRPVTSVDWTFHDIEGVVAPDATTIIFGLLLSGDGEAWIDTASLEDLGPSDVAPKGAAKAYLDDALNLLEREHINTAKVDWKALRAEADLTAAGATTPAQTYPAIREVIAALGERHTFLAPPRPRPAPGASNVSGPPERALPRGAMVGEHVAKIVLPSLLRDLTDPSDDGASYQSAIATFVTQARTDHACGWIVDLRGDSGGDMWPGMRGLAGLLGPGPHGAFVSAKGRKPWPVLTTSAPFAGAPVAVLVSTRTGSSGEMIAIAFEGRPVTRFFGEATAGFTTANAPRVLSDGAVLAVTGAYVEDRTGHRYEGPIQPDETMPTAQAETKALAWLKTQGCT